MSKIEITYGDEVQRDRRSDLLAGLSRYDDGSGTLGIIVDHALADDPEVTLDEVREIVEDAIEDARVERERA